MTKTKIIAPIFKVLEGLKVMISPEQIPVSVIENPLASSILSPKFSVIYNGFNFLNHLLRGALFACRTWVTYNVSNIHYFKFF